MKNVTRIFDKDLAAKFLLIFWISGTFVACQPLATQDNMKNIEAPTAQKQPKEIIEHDNKRIDNYFWMRLTDDQKTAEQPDEQTQAVKDYLQEENAYTQALMKHTEGFQENLFNEIVGRIKQTDESVPYFSNGYWYYVRYEEGKEYPIFCRKKESLESDEIILLNGNEMAEGKDYFQIGGFNISLDNKWLAFSTDTVSRRIYTIQIKNLETGEILGDKLENTTGSGAWANDNKTFFYTIKDEVSLLSKEVYRHKMGTSQDKDVKVYEEKDPSFYIGVYKSKSDKYIMIWNSSTLVSDYHVLNANTPDENFRNFFPRETKHEYSITHYQDKFYILTNWGAKNFRLMETPEDATGKENWKEVIAHREDVFLESFDVFKDHLVLDERKNGLTQLRVMNQSTGDEHYIDFGEAAYVAYTSTNPEFNTDVLRYGYSSMSTPSSTFDYNMNTKEKELKKQQEVVGGHEPGNYQVERIYAKARDGVDVPVSIVYKKGFKKNGKEPLLLYAYGSYGSTIDPGFSSVRLSLLDRGFAFAIAHIRGGQINGRQWYEDGKLLKKKNTFNDFVDCGRYLVAENYTSEDHIYAMGGSAGGLLMGAIVNQAPELFNGVIAAVPFVDVVSTMWDESIPLTTNEFDEWGNPKNKEYYDYMLSYSPYDNVGAKEYPHMLVTTGFFDSQVQYWEPAKWVAKLREMKVGDNVLLLHTNMEAGHGGASGRFKRHKETALEYAFLLDLEGINE